MRTTPHAQATARRRDRPVLKTTRSKTDNRHVPVDVHRPESSAEAALTLRQTETLSRREQQVLRELVGGKSNAQIAEQLFISRETVKKHVSSILGKTRTENRVQAAVAAVRRGLI
jgi:DNA-binding NarL/FixJ family response regulator